MGRELVGMQFRGPPRGDAVVQLGLIGLGKMGGNMAERVHRAGHEVVGYDHSPGKRDVESLPALVEGGNSKYTDDQVHDVMCREKGIGYIDAGVSGGVWGLENGYALMVGGTKEDVAKVQPVFDALKPPAPVDESGQEHTGDAGFVHAGPVGAGHFSKMVHNGIEYALMQAYGEGYELLAAVDLIEDVPGVIKSWTQGTVIR